MEKKKTPDFFCKKVYPENTKVTSLVTTHFHLIKTPPRTAPHIDDSSPVTLSFSEISQTLSGPVTRIETTPAAFSIARRISLADPSCSGLSTCQGGGSQWMKKPPGGGYLNHEIHLGKWTWTIIKEVWKIIFLSKWVICRFHVNLPRCSGCFKVLGSWWLMVYDSYDS